MNYCVYANNLSALNTTNKVDPSWPTTAGTIVAMPEIVNGTRILSNS